MNQDSSRSHSIFTITVETSQASPEVLAIVLIHAHHCAQQ